MPLVSPAHGERTEHCYPRGGTDALHTLAPIVLIALQVWIPLSSYKEAHGQEANKQKIQELT